MELQMTSNYKKGDLVVYIGDQHCKSEDGVVYLRPNDVLIFELELESFGHLWVTCTSTECGRELGFSISDIIPLAEYRKRVIKDIINERNDPL